MIVFYSMCYFFYKTTKNKRSNVSVRWQSENQYDKQHCDSSANLVAINQSCGKDLPATPTSDEDSVQTMYESMNMH